MNFIDRIKHFIYKYNLFKENDLLLVAVSGGVDSMVLLDTLRVMNYSIHVCHVNYQLRGEESDKDENLVRDYCKANNLKVEVLKAEIDPSSGVQEQARVVRYAWFEKLTIELKAAKLVTAHHLNDQAETLLLKISRGTGITGAAAMRPVNGKLVRPFLEISKADIEAYAALEKVPFRTDASNAQSTYARNKVRNEVIPLLESVNKSFVSNAAGFSSISFQADLWMAEEAKGVWESNSSEVPRGFALRLSEWAEKEYAQLVLHYVLMHLGINATWTKEVFPLIKSPTGKRVDCGAFVIWKNRNELLFEKKKQLEKEVLEVLINDVGTYLFSGGEISVTEEDPPVRLSATKSCIYIDPTKVSWPLKLRCWKHGDSMRPFGLGGSQNVSDILTQKKVPAADKPNVMVLTDLKDVLWVVGHRTAEKTRVSSASLKVLKILINA